MRTHCFSCWNDATYQEPPAPGGQPGIKVCAEHASADAVRLVGLALVEPGMGD
jgi:hypothetical protein